MKAGEIITLHVISLLHVLATNCDHLQAGIFRRLITKNIKTNLLTPWSRVLLEKLTGSAASQEIHRIFGTRRFITVPTSARHLSLS